MENGYTKAVAEYIAQTNYEDLSAEAIESAKKSILDTLGIMFPATTLAPPSDVVHDLYLELDCGGECTLVGYGEKASLFSAAMINGSLTHAVDFDDSAGIDKPIVHPTASCFPAALALAEHLGNVSGKQLITAIAVADDVGIRMGSCPKGNVLWDYDFFPPTTFGVFQATVAACKLLELDAQQVIDALGLAVNRVAGIRDALFNCEFRSVRDAFGNEEGIRCALLASCGFAGCPDALEQLYHIVYRDNVDLSFLVDGLGKEFYNAKLIGYKPWPSCQGTHPYVQSCLETMEDNGIASEDVENIVLVGCSQGSNLFYPKEEKSRPTTSITAKVALPYVVAVAAWRRNVVLSDFEIQNLSDPEIQAMAQRIEFQVDDSFPPNSATARITTKQGEIFEGHVDILRGSVLNPMSIDELVAKFKGNAALAKHPIQRVDDLAQACMHLEDVASVKDFVSSYLN